MHDQARLSRSVLWENSISFLFKLTFISYVDAKCILRCLLDTWILLRILLQSTVIFQSDPSTAMIYPFLSLGWAQISQNKPFPRGNHRQISLILKSTSRALLPSHSSPWGDCETQMVSSSPPTPSQSLNLGIHPHSLNQRHPGRSPSASLLRNPLTSAL